GSDCAIGISLGAHIDRLCVGHWLLQRAEIDLGQHLTAQTIVVHVVHDTDDLDIRRGSRVSADPDVAAGCEARPEICCHETRVHHRNSWGGAVVSGREVTAREHVYPHGFDVSGTDDVEMRLHDLSADSAIPLHCDAD